jgi:four helix bundle protein
MVLHFRDLDAWKAAIELAESTYKLSARFPADERFGLVSQMLRPVLHRRRP